MKKLKRQKNAFTLIEIIVVLIIVGVLAAIALPSFFSWIHKSIAGEGLASLGVYKDEVEACIQAHPGGEGICNATGPGILYLSFVNTPNFQYGMPVPLVNNLVPQGNPPELYEIDAVEINEPDSHGGYLGGIDFFRYVNGDISCQAIGDLQGVC